MSTDLVMYRGDKRTFTVTLTANDLPLDLTGLALRFTAKRKVTDADVDAVIVLTEADGIAVTNAIGGVCTVTIPPAATEDLTKLTRLVWDLQATDVAGDSRTFPDAALTRSTLGRLTVRPDVSRTTP